MNWISVKDKLPDEDQDVWYYFDMTGVNLGKYTRSDGRDCFYSARGFLCGDVTHWQPAILPLPPEDA